MMRNFVVLALFTGALWAANVQMQGMNQPQFADFDLNGDGKITSKEFDEARAKRVDKLASENRSFRNAQYASSFEEMDLDKDGVVTVEEFDKHRASRMQNRPRGGAWTK